MKQAFCDLQMPGGAGKLSTVKCPPLGTHRLSNARGLPEGMLADGIDSRISKSLIFITTELF